MDNNEREALPELPHTTYNGYSDGSEPLYTADQMREYALAARASLPAAEQPRQAVSDDAAAAIPNSQRADFIERIVLGVAEIEGRDSPEDQPEMMLVTDSELRSIIENAFEHADEEAALLAKATAQPQKAAVPQQEAEDLEDQAAHLIHMVQHGATLADVEAWLLFRSPAQPTPAVSEQVQQIIAEMREQAHAYRETDSSVGMFADPEAADLFDEFANRIEAQSASTWKPPLAGRELEALAIEILEQYQGGACISDVMQILQNVALSAPAAQQPSTFTGSTSEIHSRLKQAGTPRQRANQRKALAEQKSTLLNEAIRRIREKARTNPAWVHGYNSAITTLELLAGEKNDA